MDLSKLSDEDLEKYFEIILTLTEEENELMIKQNEKERKKEVGVSCFDTALKGARKYKKMKMKARRK